LSNLKLLFNVPLSTSQAQFSIFPELHSNL